MMAARIFRGLERKQTRACAAHDSAFLIVKIVVSLSCLRKGRLHRRLRRRS